MSAKRKATATAFLAVMLQVLVLMVVVYSMNTKGVQQESKSETLFVIAEAFGGTEGDQLPEQDASALRPEVGQALISVLSTHDLDLELTVFGKNITEALGRAATVSQLLHRSGIPSSSLQVTGAWNLETAKESSEALTLTNRIMARRKGVKDDL